MPGPFLADLRRVVCSGTIGASEVWTNVLHARDPNPLTQGTADGLAGHFASFYGELVALLPLAWFLTDITIQDYSEEDGAMFAADFGGPLQGTNASTPLPYQCSCVVTWKTGVPGRRHRGRTYLPPFGSDQIDDAGGDTYFGTGVQTTVDDAGDSLIGALLGDGRNLVIYSRVGAGAMTNVTEALVGRVVDTQRRRRSNLTEAYVT